MPIPIGRLDVMEYDPFQQQAIAHIQSGHSVIVSAPTGAGKTVIAEHVINECLRKGEKVIYTAPIKALSNQKFRDFQQHAPEKVGLLTGDVTLNAQAPILIMTTEIFRNKILEEESSLREYTWIIFDEIHYLDDYERGSVWEESLIFFPEHMNLLGLSATIPNIDELARWLESIHGRPIKVVKESKRPVPLHFFYQCQNHIYDDMERMAREGYSVPGRRNRRPAGKVPHYERVKPNYTTTLVKHLEAQDLLPCIYFVFSRRRTEHLAEELTHLDFLDAGEKRHIMGLYRELCERFDLAGDARAAGLARFVERGIAYHHAGMLPTLKEVVERLFTSRLLKVIFTTETFALGINMPARTVVFDELRKFYGRGHSNLKTRDFYQMAGRAGRRGIDTEGHVFCRVNPHYIAPDEIHKIIFSQPEKVSSRFNAAYATVLNLYNNYRERLYDVYPRSLHYYQVRRFLHKRALKLLEAKVGVLKALGHIGEDGLTDKGFFASKVYGYELMLAELYERGILEDLSPAGLGILALGIIYEPRKNAHKPSLSKPVKRLEIEAGKVLRDIQRVEREFGIRDLSKAAFFHLSVAMEAWIRGEPFEEILKRTEADEGEVVRFFRMTVQTLREIADTPVSAQLRERITGLVRVINRDVIDSEKQLRS